MAVAPTSASTTQTGQLASIAGNEVFGDNLNTFLTLLTTQLKNQDPTSPLDTNEMTQQLVSFAGVEQQVHMNKNLESLIGLQEIGQQGQAVSYIGKAVDLHTDSIVNNGDGARFSYQLKGKAQKATINIVTENGQVVFSQPVASPNQQFQRVYWTGSMTNGNPAPQGNYKIVISAFDEAGEAVESDVWTQGIVDAVDFSTDEILLDIGGKTYPLDDVQRVSGVATTSNGTN